MTPRSGWVEETESSLERAEWEGRALVLSALSNNTLHAPPAKAGCSYFISRDHAHGGVHHAQPGAATFMCARGRPAAAAVRPVRPCGRLKRCGGVVHA